MCYLLYTVSQGEKYIIAEALAKSFFLKIDRDVENMESTVLTQEELLEAKYVNPIIPDSHPLPILPASYVTSESGTGLVHSAPGHGAEDYGLLSKYSVSPFSPVDDNGAFTEAVLPESLRGLSVLGEGNEAVVSLLENNGSLLHKEKYIHRYPYDWRSKEPVIVRATEQWFANVDDIKDNALQALEGVTMIPGSAVSRLKSFVQGRSEWCISRQRAWGVPIPALYNIETGEALLTPASVEYIISVIREKGTDAWFSSDDSDQWVAPQYRDGKYRRGMETMDVWFDSGTSWSMLGTTQADIYLEGTDQHRGWFQSSLLTSVATRGVSPFKALITHGFVLDDVGAKMSKSLGNVISPRQIVEGKIGIMKAGIDGLRMWVASSDYTADVNISQQVLENVLGGLQKIRLTLRYLLGNLHDLTSLDVDYSTLSKVVFAVPCLMCSWINMRCMNSTKLIEQPSNIMKPLNSSKLPNFCKNILLIRSHEIIWHLQKIFCIASGETPPNAMQCNMSYLK